jgi:hypothetical protein
MNARKAHNTGRNHVSNVRDYFASLGHDKAQNLIDLIVSQHEGGGRQQMMAAPSMRLGAGFLNPNPMGALPGPGPGPGMGMGMPGSELFSGHPSGSEPREGCSREAEGVCLGRGYEDLVHYRRAGGAVFPMF